MLAAILEYVNGFFQMGFCMERLGWGRVGEGVGEGLGKGWGGLTFIIKKLKKKNLNVL